LNQNADLGAPKCEGIGLIIRLYLSK